MAKAVITLLDKDNGCYSMDIEFSKSVKADFDGSLLSPAIEKAIRIMNEAFSESGISISVKNNGYILNGIRAIEHKL